MEGRILRLIAEVGLLALIVWVVAAAAGEANQVRVKRQPTARRMDRKSPVWNQSPVVAPSASSGLLFSPGVVI